jgi:hypothetical protein
VNFSECDFNEKTCEDLTDEDIINFYFKKSEENEESKDIEEVIEELDININNTTFSEAKTGFELFSNFELLNLNDDKLLNNILEIEDYFDNNK